MRYLKFVFARNGSLSTLVMATVLPMSASCGGEADPGSAAVAGLGGMGGASIGGQSSTGQGGTSGGVNATGGATNGGTGGFVWSVDTSTTAVHSDFPYSVTNVPSAQCVNGFTQYFNAIVPLPPEGTPPSSTALCNASSPVPVDSGWAARITLQTNSTDPSMAHASLAIAPELIGSVVGVPSVTVIDLDSSLTAPTVSAVTALSGLPGYAFDLKWTNAPYSNVFGLPPRMVLETRFTVQCGSATREIRALTALYFCSDNGAAVGWASSGDRCIECASICEMAASPILPALTDDSMALASAVRLGVRVIGQLHGALLLLAEHDGGAANFDYSWTASGGQLVWSDRDVALWVPPESTLKPELVQVALSSHRAAAVASLRWGTLG